MLVQEARISEVQFYDFSELLLNFEADRDLSCCRYIFNQLKDIKNGRRNLKRIARFYIKLRKNYHEG